MSKSNGKSLLLAIFIFAFNMTSRVQFIQTNPNVDGLTQFPEVLALAYVWPVILLLHWASLAQQVAQKSNPQVVAA